MRRYRIALAMLVFALSALASANSVTFTVTVNTSSVAGTTGSLDFNFNPGPLVSLSTSLQLLNFAGNGTLSLGPMLTGDVSGALPGALTFTNGTAFNDYFQGFTFGSTLSFTITLNLPSGTAASGSTFAFSMFSNAAGTNPALTTDTSEGFAFLINLNPNGTVTITNFSAQTSVKSTSAVVPEPGSLGLVGTGIAIALGAFRLRRHAPG